MEAAGVPTAARLDSRAPAVRRQGGRARRRARASSSAAPRQELDAGLRRGAALGGEPLIEELLEGEEVSLFVLTDGHDAVPLAPAQDFKRVGEGDTGPNTGGMGSYSPVPGSARRRSTSSSTRSTGRCSRSSPSAARRSPACSTRA